jgi:hypothetical protein
MITHIQDKPQKLYEPLIVGSIIATLAYGVTYFLASSPILIRALGPIFGS